MTPGPHLPVAAAGPVAALSMVVEPEPAVLPLEKPPELPFAEPSLCRATFRLRTPESPAKEPLATLQFRTLHPVFLFRVSLPF